MQKSIIEVYHCSEQGYHPFLIREGWQVAKLNYMPEQDMYGIQKMDVHLHTDEAFVLLSGTAVLIGAREEADGFEFECVKMKPGIVYNMPVGQWHNIAMDKEAELLIIEKNDTHLGDFELRYLSNQQKDQLNAQINALIV